MLKKILPLVLLLIGSGAGVGAGLFLRPAFEIGEEVSGEHVGQEVEEGGSAKSNKSERGAKGQEEIQIGYVKLSNQFVIPVVRDKEVASLIVMSIGLEVPEAARAEVFRHEPKLRDSFLQVLFDHANSGGFDGAFTSTTNLEALRQALTEIGQRDIGQDTVKDVLITEIARQDY